MRTLIVALVLGLLPVASAISKCATPAHKIVGKITGAARQGISEALIEISWKEVQGEEVHHASVKTDASGEYVVRLSYAEFGGRDSSGEACVPVVAEVHLRISAAGFSTHEETLKIAGVQTTADKSLRPIVRKDGAPIER